MNLPEGWVTVAELRERRKKNMVPLMYGVVYSEPARSTLEGWRQHVLKKFIPDDLFQFRDRPKRRSHIMKEILMLQPKGPRVLVKRIDAPKPASSTIIIPETVESEKSCYAVVLAVGKAVTEDIKVADTVLLAAYSGGNSVQVELDGETLEAQIVMQDDILAVVIE